VLVQEGVIDCEQRSLFWEWNSQCPEMSLQSWVNNERTCSGIHASSIDCVFNFFQCQLVSVIPMIIIFMLSHKGNSSLGVIWVKLRHVKIVNEVNQLQVSRRSKCSTLLDQLLLEDCLKKHRVSIEVEVH
jgi:hypothetical protein